MMGSDDDLSDEMQCTHGDEDGEHPAASAGALKFRLPPGAWCLMRSGEGCARPFFRERTP